jgi:predicted secreted protein
MLRGPKTTGNAQPGDIQHPAKIQPSFSLRTVIVSVMVAALIFLLYYLFHGR